MWEYCKSWILFINKYDCEKRFKINTKIKKFEFCCGNYKKPCTKFLLILAISVFIYPIKLTLRMDKAHVKIIS